MKLMWHYTMRHKWLVLCNFVCVFGFILIELGLPTLLARIFDKGIANRDFAYIQQQVIWMIVIVLIGGTLNILLSIVGVRTTTLIIRDLRQDIFSNIQRFSHREYEKIGVSSLITRTGNDAYQLMLFLSMMLRLGIMTPMMMIFSIYLIVRTSPSLSILAFLAMPFLFLGVILIARIAEPLSKKQQKNLDKINAILREHLSGLRVIRAFVNEPFESQRFEEVNTQYYDTSSKLFKLVGLAQPAFMLLFDLVMALLIWFGAVQIGHGQLEVGNLIAFIEYIFHALFSFMLFANVFMMYPRAAVSANRMQEVLDLEPTIENEPQAQVLTEAVQELAFKEVTFAYPGQTESPIIEGISFSAQKGQVVAFIGSTGSGKSTLIQLIPRFYDVTDGQILINGQDIRHLQLADLRQAIGYIPQKAQLFTGTIADNFRFGKPDASIEEMQTAAKVAAADEFIGRMPAGFETELAEGGTNLSGGQKQRLAIARAVIRQPQIYVFDDSFSALDYRTDAQLRQQLKPYMAESITFIVAQRISTIMQADQIIVLDEGKIVGQGKHRELLATCSVYQDIANSQLSKEELA